MGGRDAGGWRNVESVPLILVSSVPFPHSVFTVWMNFPSPYKTRSITPFHRGGSGSQRRKCLADTQHKWQALGSALDPSSIVVLPRTRLTWGEEGSARPRWGYCAGTRRRLAVRSSWRRPDLQASCPSTMMESAVLALEWEVLWFRSLPTKWMIQIFYICI